MRPIKDVVWSLWSPVGDSISLGLNEGECSDSPRQAAASLSADEDTQPQGSLRQAFGPQPCVYEHLRMAGGGGDLGFLPRSFMLSLLRTERKSADLLVTG